MRRHMNMKTAIPCLLLLSLLGSLSACTDSFAAGQDNQVAARRVTFADLDLTRNRGAATLYSRIQSAAREVCEPAGANWRFKSLTGTRRCVELAINRAINEINAPSLTNYYLAITGQSIHLATIDKEAKHGR